MYSVKLSGREPEMILVDIPRSNALFTMADECSSVEAEVQIHLIKYPVPLSLLDLCASVWKSRLACRHLYSVLQSFHTIEPFSLHLCGAGWPPKR
jgi:hypothetical protein